MKQAIDDIRAAVADFLSHPHPGKVLDLGSFVMRWIDDRRVELQTPEGPQLWEFPGKEA